MLKEGERREEGEKEGRKVRSIELFGGGAVDVVLLSLLLSLQLNEMGKRGENPLRLMISVFSAYEFSASVSVQCER